MRKALSLLILLLLALLGEGGTSSLNRVLEVCPQGCPYGTLEEAFAAGNPLGRTFLLHPGVYPTALTIDAGFITIKGLDRDRVILTAREKYEPVLRIRNRSIRIENLTFQGNPDPPRLDERAFAELALEIEKGELHNAEVEIEEVTFRDWTGRTLAVHGPRAKLVLRRSLVLPHGKLGLVAPIEVENGATAQFFGNSLHVGVDVIASHIELRENELDLVGVGPESTALVVANQFTSPTFVGTRIAVGGDARAILLDNVLTSPEPPQRFGTAGIQIALGSVLEARNNQIRGFESGIHMWNNKKDTRLYLQGNSLDGNRYGVFLLVDPQQPSLLNIRGNRVTESLECGINFAFPAGTQEAVRQVLTISGEDNVFLGNPQDLCPPDFPWPPDFIKKP
jgi:hypothetical protein